VTPTYRVPFRLLAEMQTQGYFMIEACRLTMNRE
jgi:hypothetical protein